MAVNLSPIGGVAAQFFDNSGNVLSGGKIFTYAAGTTTPQASYTSSSGATAHANPIILDAAGRVPTGEIWLTDGLQYKFIIKTSTDVQIGSYDNVIGVNSNFVNYTNSQEFQTATAGQTVFTLTTMAYQPGTNSLSVFVDGVNQYGPGALYAYQETSSTVVTFTSGLHVGADVKFTTSAINASSYGDASQIAFVGFKNQVGNVQDLADADGSNWIGFEPAGTSAVARSAQDKLRDTVSVKDFGAVGDGVTNDTASFTAANAAVAYASGFTATNGVYRIADVSLAKANLYGPGAVKSVSGATALFSLASDPNTLGSAGWRYRRIVDMFIDGNGKTANGITFSSDLAGRWRIDNCFIRDCNKGFEKPTGNIANELFSTSFSSCNFGYWAKGSSSPTMHAGCDRILGGEFNSCSLAAIYIDSPIIGTGQTVIDKTVIENNPGFGVFVKNWATAITPLRLRDVWFEDNATSGSVTIDGVSYTPRDIYFENVEYGVIDGSPIFDVEFVNSQVTLENCFFDDVTSITNTNSSVLIRQANTDGLSKQNVTVETLANAQRATSGFADMFRAVPRESIVYTPPTGTTLYAENFADAGTYTLGGTTSITSTAVADGTLFTNCAEFSIPNGNTNVVGSFALTSGKFVVYTMDIKQIGTTAITAQITGPSSVTSASAPAIFKQDKWTTIGGVAPCNTTNTGFYWQLQNASGGALTFRLGPVQVIQFDSLSDALTYFNSRMVTTG